MAIEQRNDGKFTVTCRDETGASRFAVRDTRPLAEGFFIFTASAKSCGMVPRLSFAGLVEWYLLHGTHDGVKSIRKYYDDVVNHAVSRFGDKTIAAVTLGDLHS